MQLGSLERNQQYVGYGTINGNTDPLYVIDGFPTNADNFRSNNPNDIETFTVLKDAAATTIYGNRGSNCYLITTKCVGSSKSLDIRLIMVWFFTKT
jgi:TonB-dependent SusC/RagA subfamily outer membrane receptor